MWLRLLLLPLVLLAAGASGAQVMTASEDPITEAPVAPDAPAEVEDTAEEDGVEGASGLAPADETERTLRAHAPPVTSAAHAPRTRPPRR